MTHKHDHAMTIDITIVYQGRQFPTTANVEYTYYTDDGASIRRATLTTPRGFMEAVYADWREEPIGEIEVDADLLFGDAVVGHTFRGRRHARGVTLLTDLTRNDSVTDALSSTIEAILESPDCID